VDQRFQKGNRFELLLNKIKKELSFESAELETVHEVIGKGAFIATVKYDGELTAVAFKEGAGLASYNRYGRVRWEYPALDEFCDLVRAAGHTECVVFAELYAVSLEGTPLPLNQTMSIIKKPKSIEAEHQIRLAIFDIYSLDGKRIYGRAPYADRFLLVNDLFRKGHYVHPVAGRDFESGDKVVSQMWDKHVLDENYEGLVVRANHAVKIKPQFSIDLAVVGIFEGKGRHKGTLGGLITAFLDHAGRFLYAARPGTGLSDADRDWFWNLLEPQVGQVGKFFGRKNTMLVPPQLVVEVMATTFVERDVESMTFDPSSGLYYETGMQPGWTLQFPRFIRIREDKGINMDDLRLEQVPVMA
jgi:ATP-dependent DNA ligase